MFTYDSLNILLDLMTIFLLALFLATFSFDKGCKMPGRRDYYLFFLSVLVGVSADAVSVFLDGDTRFGPLNLAVVSILGIMTFLDVVLMGICLWNGCGVSPKRQRILRSVYYSLLTLWAVAQTVLTVTGDAFYLDESGIYTKGPAWLYLMAVPILLPVVTSVTLLFTHPPVKVKLFSIGIGLIPAAGVAINYLFPDVPVIPLATTTVCFLMYLHAYLGRLTAYYADTIEDQTRRTNLMISQVKPHFLYNTLAGIAGLCQVDPDGAAEALSAFAKYLRGNLDSVDQLDTIPFNREMAHVRAYVELEKIRLADRLEVEYDLRYTDFSVPAVSILPLVENAIQHGLATEGRVGKVILSSWSDRTYYYVMISDNGVGFAPAMAAANSGAGIEAVRARLKQMVQGTLDVLSKPDVGTSATVKIPIHVLNNGEECDK